MPKARKGILEAVEDDPEVDEEEEEKSEESVMEERSSLQAEEKELPPPTVKGGRESSPQAQTEAEARRLRYRGLGLVSQRTNRVSGF